MPRTGAPPMIGDTPTTGAEHDTNADRIPGTDRIAPIDTTGFDGGSSTTSAAAMASSTPGPGFASSAPTNTIDCAGTSACSRTHHSWKWIAFGPSPRSTTTCVSTRSSLIGNSSTPGFHRAHSAAVTADSG